MDIIDVRWHIVSNLLDYSTLKNICSTDKYINNQGSKLFFWKPIFNQYNLPLPNHDIQTTTGWIKAYIHTIKTTELITAIIHKIHVKKSDLKFFTINFIMKNKNVLFNDVKPMIQDIEILDPTQFKKVSSSNKIKNKYIIRSIMVQKLKDEYLIKWYIAKQKMLYDSKFIDSKANYTQMTIIIYNILYNYKNYRIKYNSYF